MSKEKGGAHRDGAIGLASLEPEPRAQQLFVDWLNELADAQGVNSGESSHPSLGTLLAAVHAGAPFELCLFYSLFPKA